MKHWMLILALLLVVAPMIGCGKQAKTDSSTNTVAPTTQTNDDWEPEMVPAAGTHEHGDHGHAHGDDGHDDGDHGHDDGDHGHDDGDHGHDDHGHAH